MNDSPRVIPPRDELAARREQERRRSALEWLHTIRERLAKDKP